MSKIAGRHLRTTPKYFNLNITIKRYYDKKINAHMYVTLEPGGVGYSKRKV